MIISFSLPSSTDFKNEEGIMKKCGIKALSFRLSNIRVHIYYFGCQQSHVLLSSRALCHRITLVATLMSIRGRPNFSRIWTAPEAGWSCGSLSQWITPCRWPVHYRQRWHPDDCDSGFIQGTKKQPTDASRIHAAFVYCYVFVGTLLILRAGCTGDAAAVLYPRRGKHTRNFETITW